MTTSLQYAQLLAAGGIPVSLWIVMHQIRDVKWTRLTPGIVVSVLFATFILTSEGVVHPLGAGFVTMLLLGHTMTFLDDD